MSKNEPLTLEELANGHCLAVANAFRLIQDGEVLLEAKKWLSAINLFKLASEELAKAHIITQASVFDESDSEKWEWFWRSLSDHREKLRILEYELHWGGYQDKDEFNRRVSLLRRQREDTLYVGFNHEQRTFIAPGSVLGDAEEFATVQHRYVIGVLQLFVVAGLPTPEVQLSVYKRSRKRMSERSQPDE